MSDFLIHTDRLVIQQWKDADTPCLVSCNQDPRVMEFYPRIRTAQETINEHIPRIKADYLLFGFGMYSVVLRETNEWIGLVGLQVRYLPLPFMPCVEIGWRLLYDFWGKGYATEAARAVMNYGFEHLKMHEIYSWTTEKNVRSQRVMQKLGMIHDEKNDFVHPHMPNDHPLAPHVVYRITQHEWNELQKGKRI